MTLAALALAGLMGVALGLLGGGGSILAVPILVYAAGLDAKVAIVASLAVVGTASLAGVLRHRGTGNLDLRAALVFGPVAMVSTYVGAKFSLLISGDTQLVIFALVMLAAAAIMFRDRKSAAGACCEETSGKSAKERFPYGLIPLAVAVGALTGIVGVGGGFLIVPALVMLGGLPMKRAVGTSLLVIAMNSAAGFAGHLGEVTIPWTFIFAFTLAALAGVGVGSHTGRFIEAEALRKTFAVFLVVMAVFVLFENAGTLLPA